MVADLKVKFDIMDYIPMGSENGITERHLGRILGCSTRKVRSLINEARENNIIVNTQDGSGFFVPDFGKKEDVQVICWFCCLNDHITQIR